VGQGAHYYRGVKGSRALATAPLAAATPLSRAEAIEPGEMLRVPVGGDLLGAARVRARYAPIPLDAFDRAAPLLEAEEQAAWFHLLRLSYGEGRNFCRAGKRDLMARLGLSERRLLRVLAGLVEKRFLRPVHRDNRGTAWRVHLPAEVLGEAPGDDVLLGRACDVAPPAPPAPPAGRRPAPRRGPVSILSLAEALARARGRDADREALDRAAADVADLLAEGHTREQVQACIQAIGRRGGRPAPGQEVAP